MYKRYSYQCHGCSLSSTCSASVLLVCLICMSMYLQSVSCKKGIGNFFKDSFTSWKAGSTWHNMQGYWKLFWSVTKLLVASFINCARPGNDATLVVSYSRKFMPTRLTPTKSTPMRWTLMKATSHESKSAKINFPQGQLKVIAGTESMQGQEVYDFNLLEAGPNNLFYSN